VIPVNEPALGARELEYVTECVTTGWISSAGRFVDEFERAWADYCGRRHGASVCNGTAALQIAVEALDLGPGDEVIMPSFTIISCALAVVLTGATPVLVDSDPGTWTMDVRAAAERVTPQTRAIMPVHIYGHPVEMEPLLAFAAEHELAIVEDAAEAHGAECSVAGEWRRAGSFGELSTFSFFANKLVTTGEGGMVVTDDDALAARLRALRNLSFLPERRFYHEALGYNYRLTNLQAALGVAQVERMGEIVQRKRELGTEYVRRLSSVPGLQMQVEEPWARSVHWMVGLVLDEDVPFDALELGRLLRERGVDTRPFFLGMHEQPALHARGLFEGERYPVAERLARRGLYLPSGLALTDEQQATVCDAVEDSLS
jgi:perosamine synthetase